MRNRTKLFLCEVEDLFILNAVLVYEDVRSSLKVQENNLRGIWIAVPLLFKSTEKIHPTSSSTIYWKVRKRPR